MNRYQPRISTASAVRVCQRLSAMKGNGPKWCKNIVVRKFFDDNLAQAEKTEESKNGEK